MLSVEEKKFRRLCVVVVERLGWDAGRFLLYQSTSFNIVLFNDMLSVTLPDHFPERWCVVDPNHTIYDDALIGRIPGRVLDDYMDELMALVPLDALADI